jgi:hypothetical protein
MVASKLLQGNARRSEADFGYHDLQSIYNSEDGSQETSDKVTPVVTQTDTQLKAAKHLFVSSARFRNAAKVLKVLCAGIGDPNTSRTKIKEKLKQIQQHIIPLLTHAADTIEETATAVAPIGCVKYVHNRNERKRRIELVDPNDTKMGADLKLVAHHVREEISRQKQKKALKNGSIVEVTPPKKKKSHRTTSPVISPPTKSEEEKEYPLPKPNGGKEYSKAEVVEIVSKTLWKSKERGRVVQALVDYQIKHGVLGCGKRTIQRMMDQKNKKTKPIINKEWTYGGQPPKCTDAEVEEIALSCEKNQGKSYNRKDVKEMINKKYLEKLDHAGVKDILKSSVSDSTVRNYHFCARAGDT